MQGGRVLATEKGERGKGDFQEINASLPLKNAIPHYYHLFLDSRLYSMSQIAPGLTKHFIDTDGQEEEQASHKD